MHRMNTVRRPGGSSDPESEIFAGGRAAFQTGSPDGAAPAPTNGSARASGKALAHLVSRTGGRLPDRSRHAPGLLRRMQPWRANRAHRLVGPGRMIRPCGKMAGAGRLISSFPAGGVPSTLPGKPATDSIDRRWESDAKRHDTSREEPFDEGARPWPSPRLPGRAPPGGEGGRTNGSCPAPGRRRSGSRRSACDRVDEVIRRYIDRRRSRGPSPWSPAGGASSTTRPRA